MIITGDNHTGAGRRRSIILRMMFYKAFAKFLEYCENTYSSDEVIVVAGDCFDTAEPRPGEYTIVQNILRKYYKQKKIFLPGNHDNVLADGVSAINVLSGCPNVSIQTSTVSFELNGRTFSLLPVSANMFEQLKEMQPADVLISHFGTNQMNFFAGVIDESDEVFQKFQKVILGDIHTNYHSPDLKFWTTGATYYTKINEMLNNKASYLHLDESTLEVTRVLLTDVDPLFRVDVITDEEEATDPERMYVLYGDKQPTKPNILVYNKVVEASAPEGEETPQLSTIAEESFTLDSFVSTFLKDVLPEKDRLLVVQLAKGEIDESTFVESILSAEEDTICLL